MAAFVVIALQWSDLCRQQHILNIMGASPIRERPVPPPPPTLHPPPLSHIPCHTTLATHVKIRAETSLGGFGDEVLLEQ